MENKFKYARTPLGTRRSTHLRRFQDPVQHDKYYAYIKHKAQASHRQESHRLSWSQWQLLWPAALWSRRGRKPKSLRLVRKDLNKGWSLKNCEVTEHGAHMSKTNLARNVTEKWNVGPI